MIKQTWGNALTEATKENQLDKSDAMLLLEYATNKNRNQILLSWNEAIPAECLERFREHLEKRRTHLPVQYITGQQNFFGLEFRVTPAVLIPRPETELLVERVIKHSRGKRILDLCTGSGCIAVTIAKLGEPQSVAATDLSELALEVARRNAEAHQTEVDWYCGDLFAPLQGKQFDIIVSNPPYIPSGEINSLMPEVRDFEPHLALDGSKDGLAFYRRIAAEAQSFLAPDGQLFLEIGCEQGAAVCTLLEQTGWAEIHCHRDYSGLDRIIETKKQTGG